MDRQGIVIGFLSGGAAFGTTMTPARSRSRAMVICAAPTPFLRPRATSTVSFAARPWAGVGSQWNALTAQNPLRLPTLGLEGGNLVVLPLRFSP